MNSENVSRKWTKIGQNEWKQTKRNEPKFILKNSKIWIKIWKNWSKFEGKIDEYSVVSKWIEFGSKLDISKTKRSKKKSENGSKRWRQLNGRQKMGNRWETAGKHKQFLVPSTLIVSVLLSIWLLVWNNEMDSAWE